MKVGTRRESVLDRRLLAVSCTSSHSITFFFMDIDTSSIELSHGSSAGFVGYIFLILTYLAENIPDKSQICPFCFFHKDLPSFL